MALVSDTTTDSTISVSSVFAGSSYITAIFFGLTCKQSGLKLLCECQKGNINFDG